jgi:hypothetical protein
MNDSSPRDSGVIVVPGSPAWRHRMSYCSFASSTRGLSPGSASTVTVSRPVSSPAAGLFHGQWWKPPSAPGTAPGT